MLCFVDRMAVFSFVIDEKQDEPTVEFVGEDILTYVSPKPTSQKPYDSNFYSLCEHRIST